MLKNQMKEETQSMFLIIPSITLAVLNQLKDADRIGPLYRALSKQFLSFTTAFMAEAIDSILNGLTK